MKTTLYLARHGETEWNVAKKFQGHRDSPLTANGISQAQSLAAALTDRQIERVYCSDLGRALRTAGFVAERLGVELVVDARLRERSYGILEGLTHAEFDERYPAEAARFRMRNPDHDIRGGESLRQTYERSMNCLEELVRENAGSTFAVISHGGIVTCAFYKALNLPLNSPRRFSLHNASVNRISITDGDWFLETWGEVPRGEGR